MYLYDSVVKWNDSAGEEAFHNAKSRFWAKINGLPCDISMPDPNIYIDEIDWNCSVDPDLLLDLEREPNPPVVREGDEVIAGLYEALGLYQSYSGTGWGEAEEDFQKPNAVPFKAEHGNFVPNADDGGNSWEMNYAPKNSVGLRDEYLNNSVGWNDWGNNHNESDRRLTDGIWRTSWGDANANSKKMSGNWYHSTSFKASRFHCDGYGYQKENGWRNRRGRKRVNFAHEAHAPETSWNRFNSSAPVSHHWSGHAVQRNQFCEY
ncbi:uncharacterized protein LOC111021336 isoform X2 [Momordica charantia]|nr:uncharacterized protein LOC111021336 isoform X2 [Momordica charantia]